MGRFLLGCLALGALAMMISQAVADANNMVNNPAENNGVLIIESYTTSTATTPDDNMQPLPGDPGVEVAPLPDNSSMVQPVMVEEEGSMTIEQTND